MEERMASYHEVAHAIANYLTGIHMTHVCIADIGSQWIGECVPITGSHLKIQCVGLIAGMFGAQISEGKASLTVPRDTAERIRYGFQGWDYEKSWSKCATMILNRTQGWVNDEALKVNPALFSLQEQQRKTAKTPTSELHLSLMQFTLELIEANRFHIENLAQTLLRQPLQVLTPNEHLISQHSHQSLSVRRMYGSDVELQLESAGLIFGTAREEVESIPYPEGYDTLYS